MTDVFPGPILDLPEADLPIEGARAWLSQGEGHQILFMRFDRDVAMPEHAHAGQWGVMLEGRIELTTGGQRQVFTKGDKYFIPPDVRHSARIYAGYADITFFDQADRYPVKSKAGFPG